MFHAIDQFACGRLKSDKAWEELNEAGFQYSAMSKPVREDFWLISDGRAGFLNEFATTNLAEDKAAVFAQMLTHYTAVQERAEQDAIVWKKVLHMKDVLRQLCPEVDEAFWGNVQRKTDGRCPL